MPYSVSINATTIREGIGSNQTPQAIEEELQSKGLNAASISDHLKEYKRLRNAKRQFTGFVLMAIGAFIGFLSCVLTVSEFFPEWYNFILYGLTIIGVSIVFMGLYFVFE